MEKWTEWLDEGYSFDCIYYDFAKAFDSVPHARLIVKLEAYGIKGKLLEWITAFLNKRQQRVVVNSSHSDWSEVSSGVPQGSALGPVLFLVYINDIEDEIRKLLRLFADDTKLFGCTNSKDDINDLQCDNDELEEWSDKWLLSYNMLTNVVYYTMDLTTLITLTICMKGVNIRRLEVVKQRKTSPLRLTQN